METTTNQNEINHSVIRLGDTVEGNYFGTKFTGIVESFDSVGGFWIATEITHKGLTRNGVYMDRNDRISAPLRVVARRELAIDEVIQGIYLTKLAWAVSV